MSISNTTAESTKVTGVISELLCGILGLDEGTELDATKPMNAMGLDSLLAMDLIVALESKYDIKLKDTVHVDHPTIGALAAHISEKQKQ